MHEWQGSWSEGKTFWIVGFIVLDFGLFNLSLTDAHSLFIILYLLGMYAFNGAIDVMRAFEQKKYGSRWKLKLATGFIEISVALTAFFGGFIFRSKGVVVLVFALGLAYSGVVKAIEAFRKNTMMSIL